MDHGYVKNAGNTDQLKLNTTRPAIKVVKVPQQGKEDKHLVLIPAHTNAIIPKQSTDKAAGYGLHYIDGSTILPQSI